MNLLEFYNLYYGQLKWGYIFIWSNLIIGALIPVLLGAYSWKNKKSIVVLLCQAAVSCAIMDAVGAALQHFFGSAFFEPFLGCLVSLLVFAVGTRFFSLKSRIAVCAAYAGLCALTLTFTQCIGAISGVEDLVLQRFLIGINLCLIAIPTALFRRFGRNWMPNRLFAGVYTLYCAVCFLFGASWWMWNLPNLIVISITFIMLILLIAVGYAIYSMNIWMMERNQQQAEKIMRQADDNMMHVLTDLLEKEQGIRHDLRNHMLVMQALLEQKEYDKLHDYFMEYSGQLVPVFIGFRCPNRAITAVIGMETDKASHRNILLESSIAVPAEMGFGDADIASVLMNLLDNAIEYLERNQDFPERTVFVEIRLIRRTLVITVRNPILERDAKGALSGKTSKVDKDIHGYGTKIVASIARTYDGAVYYETKDGFFEASVMLTEPDKETQP